MQENKKNSKVDLKSQSKEIKKMKEVITNEAALNSEIVKENKKDSKLN